MTRQQAIKYLKEMKDRCNDTFHKVRYVTKEETLDMAIKALEKEPTDNSFTKADIDAIAKAINEGWELRVNEILDQIRAEIIEDCGYSKDYVSAFTYSTIKLKTVLQIIDKYKAEMRREDGNEL